MSEFSIIIPTLNEGPRLETLLPYLYANADPGALPEIIISDGGSTDDTKEIARKEGALVISAPRGRASQMNAGAKQAKGRILYFLHADSLPPPNFQSKITSALKRRETAGCFRIRFEPSNAFLSAFAWCSRLNFPICRGGDQSLFLPKKWFEALGGFDERYRVYEDNEFTGRLYRHYTFTVLPSELRTSARRYREKGVYQLQFHYAVVHLKKFFGASPESLYRYYKKHISVEPKADT
ncbi:TIGR04283 family arsenosugar biosynthesis glycosyltransferase [Robiginitalea aurantiaca]|uniref:TIGR04283 family arsenosugar biosynthesis glycosyltransferase n=1 Tax=Robiginitalea aurantiaca TaxID=3056915 RepID=A0ABT7WEV0_9FLAO|nr:TIGR04283 family arsenosugar biosynthesis glycosyltransferase [Robiginitalea aurantiaca]MDM9631447.1 TIGR04283 family arsenosugar biosynthesis glycosyltransferase [Robiginitalea aurantiaca]